MGLRRGFKAEAERKASDLRKEMGRAPGDALLPLALADFLRVEVVAGDELIPTARFQTLQATQENAFSACTFSMPGKRTVVVYNPLHNEGRRNSDLAHELSHIVLNHRLSRVEHLDGVGFLVCDHDQEDEANWLSGCLLLPRDLLMRELARGRSEDEIAAKCSVSSQMVTYRINVTGVRRQLNRSY